MQRREVLATTGVVVTGALAGCGNLLSNSSMATSTPSEQRTAMETARAFWDAIEAGDGDAASTYVHADATFEYEDILNTDITVSKLAEESPSKIASRDLYNNTTKEIRNTIDDRRSEVTSTAHTTIYHRLTVDNDQTVEGYFLLVRDGEWRILEDY